METVAIIGRVFDEMWDITVEKKLVTYVLCCSIDRLETELFFPFWVDVPLDYQSSPR
jgi:hypothetical protein